MDTVIITSHLEEENALELTIRKIDASERPGEIRVK